MRAFLTLADSATAHPDGTVSMIRSGLNHLWPSPEWPIRYQGALVGRLEMEPSEAGPHKLLLQCIDQTGVPTVEPMVHEFTAPQNGGILNVVFGALLVVGKPGRQVFSMLVDGEQVAAWPVTAAEKAL